MGDLIGRTVFFTRVQEGWSVLDYVKALVQIKKFRIFKAFLKYAYPSCWYDNIAKHKWNILRVISKCDNREFQHVWNLCLREMWKGGTFAYLHTEERESKSLSKRKTAGAEVKGTKYFYTSLFGICEFTFVVTDTPKLLPLVISGQN